LKAFTSLASVQEAITTDQITLPDLVQYYLDNIEAKKNLNAFTEVYASEAIDQARAIQKKINTGNEGLLAGMVIGIKDLLCHKDKSLQSGSKILEGFKSQFTATSIQRLLDEDVIIIGRQNCDEFAMGSSNEHSVFGPVKNAANEDYVPGGSSGGSAVAVQADMCLASIGSDTGGSVRQPAAFCGVIGLKPSYSRISRYGLSAYGSSFDCIGPITKSVDDAALLLQVMAGADEYDSTVSQQDVPNYADRKPLNKPSKIAYIKGTIIGDGIDEEISSQTQEVLDRLEAEGHIVEAVDFSLTEYLLPVYYILTTAESSTNLSRFDGVRFGISEGREQGLESMYKKTRSIGFGAEVKKRIMLGTFVLSEGYFDAYFTQAQKVRRLIRDETKEILEKYDFIIAPTTPTPAFKLNSHDRDPLQMYLEDILTVQASLAGVPAISIPNGNSKLGLPIGLQVIANSFEEEKLLSFSDFLLKNIIEGQPMKKT
jgi:aspartyl-tRNA(Asn)/glutamyl-tRNA(Gln) amidotransferase subunit A